MDPKHVPDLSQSLRQLMDSSELVPTHHRQQFPSVVVPTTTGHVSVPTTTGHPCVPTTAGVPSVQTPNLQPQDSLVHQEPALVQDESHAEADLPFHGEDIVQDFICPAKPILKPGKLKEALFYLGFEVQGCFSHCTLCRP